MLDNEHGPYDPEPYQTIVAYHFRKFCDKLGVDWTTLYEIQSGLVHYSTANTIIHHDGKVYLSGSSAYSEIYIYDIALDTITTVTLTSPQSRMLGRKSIQEDYNVYSTYAVGTYDISDKYDTLNQILLYDLDPASPTVYQNLISATLPAGHRNGSYIKTKDDALYFLFYDPSEYQTDPDALSDNIWAKPDGGSWSIVGTIPSAIMTELNTWIGDSQLLNAQYSKLTDCIYLIMSDLYFAGGCFRVETQYAVEYNLNTGIWTEISGIPSGEITSNGGGAYTMKNGLIYYLCEGAYWVPPDKCAETPYLIEFNPIDKTFTQIAGYPRQVEESKQDLALNCPFVFTVDGNVLTPLTPITGIHYYNI